MEIIGRGTKSTVYDNGDTVIMTGDFKRDMFKLAVHAMLGKLQALELNGKFYNATIEKMYSIFDYSMDTRNQVWDMMDFVDNLSNSSPSDYEFLGALQQKSSGTLQQIVEFILMLGINVDQCTFWLDNHDGNYLIDDTGDIVPFDLFDFSERDLNAQARDTIRQMLIDYVR